MAEPGWAQLAGPQGLWPGPLAGRSLLWSGWVAGEWPPSWSLFPYEPKGSEVPARQPPLGPRVHPKERSPELGRLGPGPLEGDRSRPAARPLPPGAVPPGGRLRAAVPPLSPLAPGAAGHRKLSLPGGRLAAQWLGTLARRAELSPRPTAAWAVLSACRPLCDRGSLLLGLGAKQMRSTGSHCWGRGFVISSGGPGRKT